MATVTRRLNDLTLQEHTISVPLVWTDPTDTRTIDVFACVVSREGGENLPYLVYLQGGPGFEAPRAFHAPSSPSWLDTALQEYRVVMLDQRGTGRSTPVGDRMLVNNDDSTGAGTPPASVARSRAVAEYLTHLRADNIVRDAEALREYLGVSTWSILGQSFGGFTSLTYVSLHAQALEHVFITGGLSAIDRTPDEVYAASYSAMQRASESYYRRFPEHRDRMRRLVDLAASGALTIPTGEVVSVSRLRSIGSALGMNDGWQSVWQLLELDPFSNAFSHDLADALPFSGRNPLYFVVHESCYANGVATRWAAQRAMPAAFFDDPTLFTGEHVHQEWTETVPAFRPWKDVALTVAEHEWGNLYDRAAIAASNVQGAAAVYVNDVFVPFAHSLATAGHLPGLRLFTTSEYEHNGLRAGPVLQHLFDLAHDRAMR